MASYDQVKAALTLMHDELSAKSSAVLAVGVGFADENATRREPGTDCVIVVILDENGDDRAEAAFPSSVTLTADKLRSAAADDEIDGDVEIPVRIEREDIQPLIVKEQGEPVVEPLDDPAARGAGAFLLGGDPIYTSAGDWIGTGGCVLRIYNTLCLVSNAHVLSEMGGVGGRVRDHRGRVDFATVNELRTAPDSAWAQLDSDAGYRNDIPYIGQIRWVGGPMQLGWHGRKYGSSTGWSDFHFRFEGTTAGGTPAVGGWWEGQPHGGKPTVGNGDSGSVVVGDGGEVMGLVFAGSEKVGTSPGGSSFRKIWCVSNMWTAFPGPEVPAW
ncbi:MAG TPA: hypothetical protein VF517_02120 [Thermoleophilaceae bacterium]